jgi:hypothetical protein
MEYMKTLFRPVRVATVTLSTFIFVSGCETTSGVPELTNDPQPAPRETRTAVRESAPQTPARETQSTVAAPADDAQTAPRCNPAPVPGVKPAKYCDY